MFKAIMSLTDLSYQLGIIGLIEYRERLAIYRWLQDTGYGMSDPRIAPGEGNEFPKEERMHDDESIENSRNNDSQSNNSNSGGGHTCGEEEEDDTMHFVAFRTWHFTVGDKDCFPSVPHGHYRHKTNPWPKLNPFTGVVYRNMNTEDISARLTKREMKSLWNDSKFIEECRKQICWYSEFSPQYLFPNARFGRHILPKW